MVERTKTIAIPSDGNKSQLIDRPILVVQTAFLGDLLLSIPLFRRIKQLRPHSPLVLVAREGAGRLLKELDLVDEVFEVKKNNSESYKAAQNKLRLKNFEWILCPHESLHSAFFCWGIPAELKISYWQIWNFIFFKERIKKDQFLPEALRQLSLLGNRDPELATWMQEISGTDYRKADSFGRLAPVPWWASLSLREKLLHRPSPLPAGPATVCIFPGSVWATKQWTEEGFVQTAESLVKEGFQIYWMGSKDEMPATKKLEVRVKGSRSVAGQLSLFQSLVLLSHSRLAISNDSGGQHMAAVAGTPSVSIFGPTILEFGFRPWSSHAVVAELFDVKCRPCGKHGHRRCPKGTHECMKRLPAKLVHQRIHQVLAGS